jgi:hypothetical protein
MTQSPLCKPDHLSTNADAAFIQRLDRNLISFANLTKNLVIGDPASVEDYFAGGRGSNAEFIFFMSHLQAGSIAGDQEAGDPFVALVGIRIGEYQK